MRLNAMAPKTTRGKPACDHPRTKRMAVSRKIILSIKIINYKLVASQ
jgi:hypothetical protein